MKKIIMGVVCHNCGITEDNPAFNQKYCRYCGTKFNDRQIEFFTDAKMFFRDRGNQ